MKKTIKQILSALLVAVMLVGAIPLSASAAYENTYTNTGNQRDDIIGVAKTQLGYTEGANNATKYGTWYGLPNQPWCAMFISWCARQAGISKDILQNSAVAAPDAKYFNIPYYDGASYTPQKGDLFFTKSWSHVGLVYYVDGSYFYTIEGNSNTTGSSEGTSVVTNRRKISNFYFGVPNYNSGTHTHSYVENFEAAHPHRIYAKCSCGDYYYTGETRAYNNCSTCMKLSWAFVQPFYAYTINTGKTIVYDAVNGKAKSNKIYDTDLCTIEQVYACDWCKVTFPLDSGGTDTGYCKVTVFMKSGGFIMYTSQKIDTYRRADLSTKLGYTGSGDKIYIAGYTSSAIQIAYPLTGGGYKVGWIPNSAIKSTIAYNANGGSGTMSSSGSPTYQKSFKLSDNTFTKSGYSFAGWNVHRKSDNKWYVKSGGWKTEKEIAANGYTKSTYSNKMSATLDQSWVNLGATNDTLTFYAVWKANSYTISYNANGGSNAPAKQTKQGNSKLTLSSTKPAGKSFTVTYNANGGTVSTSSKTVSQTFTSWNTAANGSGTAYNAGATYSANASVTLYAQYANPSIGSLPTPTRSGYAFNGWYTAASGGTKITDSTKVTANTTVYAHWTKNAETKAVVKGVKIEHNATLNYKSTYMLSPEITADDGAKYTVRYESSDTKVATVDNNGKIYGAKKGNATITCTVTDDYGNVVTDKCNVNVDYSGVQWVIIIVLFGWIWYI